MIQGHDPSRSISNSMWRRNFQWLLIRKLKNGHNFFFLPVTFHLHVFTIRELYFCNHHHFLSCISLLTTLRFGDGSGFTRGSLRGLDLLRGAVIRAGLRAILVLAVRVRVERQVPEALPDLPCQVIGCISCFLMLLSLGEGEGPRSKVCSDPCILSVIYVIHV